jgi:hypothetical protein
MKRTTRQLAHGGAQRGCGMLPVSIEQPIVFREGVELYTLGYQG